MDDLPPLPDLRHSRDRRPGLCKTCFLDLVVPRCIQCGNEPCGCSMCRLHMKLLKSPRGEELRVSGMIPRLCEGDTETMTEAEESEANDLRYPPPVWSTEATAVPETAPAAAKAEVAPVPPVVRETRAPRVRRAKEPEAQAPASFRAILRLCGLSGDEAAVLLGQAPWLIRKKSAGSELMTATDFATLRSLWDRIREGEIEQMPAGAVEAARALRALQNG